MIAILAGAAALYGALVGGLYFFQRDLLFLPDTTRPSLAQAGVPRLSEATLTTADGLRLLAWHAPAQGSQPTILYLHGNGGHIGYRADRARRLIAAGYGLLLVEYRGYGGNPGSPSEEGFHSDAEAALAWLGGSNVVPSRVVLYGESLGTAVATRLAAETAARGSPAAALILEAPFTSIADVAQHHYPYVPARSLVRDRFDAVSRIAAVRTPVLVMHGERDRVVPVEFGRALFSAAVEPKRGWFTPAGDHATIFDVDAFNVLQAFIAEHVR